MGRSPTWRLRLLLFVWAVLRAGGGAEPFIGVPTNGSAPLQAQFSDALSGHPAAWQWFFGDENSEDEHLDSDAVPRTPLRFLPLGIVALSLVLFLIGCRRHGEEPLEGRLYAAHVVSLSLLSLGEIGYVVALREDCFWFCMYGTMGWQKAGLLCFLFGLLLVNQALCHVYAPRDLSHHLGVVVPWWWGLLSLPIAPIAAAVCALASWPALVVVGILFGMAQFVQVGQLVCAVAPAKGRVRAALSAMMYLVWTAGLAVAAMGFLALLGLSLMALLHIAG